MIGHLFLGQLHPNDKFELNGKVYTVVSYDLRNRRINVNSGGRVEKFDRMMDVRVPDATLWETRRLSWYHPGKDSL